MQLTLNSAQVHPAQLAADHSRCETFCLCQKRGLACNWSPVTHSAQHLCSTASWRCPLSTWICVACTALTITPLLFMFCFLTGKVLGGQLRTHKYMYSISMSVITWRPLCLLPAKDKTLSSDATHCMTNATGWPCPANPSRKSPFWGRATLQRFPSTPGENPPPQRHSYPHSLSFWELLTGTVLHSPFC